MIPPGPSDPAPPGSSRRWTELHRDILACTRCVESGHLASAAPIFQGRPGQPLMLIGQAPGLYEVESRKPFAARSGRELERWMRRAGFTDEAHFRSLTYLTSVTKCFPGRSGSGSGDRRPSAVEVAQCLPWLEAQLELLDPRLVILTGTLAIDAFLPGHGLDAVVSRLFRRDGTEVPAGGRATRPYLLPLPHPSGASRWLNQPAHRVLLEHALSALRELWPQLVDVQLSG
jgi:uracil-DNA glycosylase